MKDILETLERQHQALTAQAGALVAALGEADETALQEPLKRLRTMLEAHFALEETRFYPELVRLTDERGTDDSRQLARLFQSNMKNIAEGVSAFFRRYDGKPKPLAEFGPQVATTLEVLARRMKEEERSLHAMVRKLLASASR